MVMRRVSPRVGLVPHLRKVAVGNVLNLVQPALVTFLPGDDEDVGPGGDVAVLVDVGRVEIACAVHDEVVAVELGLQRLGGVGPDSVLSLYERVFDIGVVALEVSGDAHRDRLGHVEPEGHAVVIVDLRGYDGG